MDLLNRDYAAAGEAAGEAAGRYTMSASGVEAGSQFAPPPATTYVEKVKETAKQMPVWGWLAIGVGGLVLGSVLIGVVAKKK